MPSRRSLLASWGAASLAAGILRIHADRAQTAKREMRLLSRFTGAHPDVPIIGVPSLPFDVSDLDALRALADQMTSGGAAEAPRATKAKKKA